MDDKTLIEQNQSSFQKIIQATRPDIFVLMNLIDEFKINTAIVFKYLYHLNDLSGDKWGDIVTEVENGVVRYIRGTEKSKLEEPIVLEMNQNNGR